MDTYSLQRAILQTDLPPTVKLIGMTLALHIDRNTGKVRLRRETVAELCGVSVATVKRAFTSLVEAGLFTRKITGRSVVMSASAGNNTGRVDGSPMTRQTGHRCTIQKVHTEPSRSTKCPFHKDYDLSTKGEEEYKRPLVQNG